MTGLRAIVSLSKPAVMPTAANATDPRMATQKPDSSITPNTLNVRPYRLPGPSVSRVCHWPRP